MQADTDSQMHCLQQKYCCKQGGTLLSSAAVRYQQRFRQDKHLWAFVCYLLLLIFIHQRLGADTAMNSLPAAIPDRVCLESMSSTNIECFTKDGRQLYE